MNSTKEETIISGNISKSGSVKKSMTKFTMLEDGIYKVGEKHLLLSEGDTITITVERKEE